MATPADIATRIVNALYVSDPELDTSIGTPLRKVIDAFSEQMSQATVDSYLTDYTYDVDSRSGGDLDDFCANFGIARLIGARSSGSLTFSRTPAMAAAYTVTIPAGTQAVTTSIPELYFQTTVAATMDIGQTSVDVPTQALVVGPESNILAGTPLQLLTTMVGLSTVSNPAAFVGGTRDESDEQLRSRFKSSVFRNLAGTDSMYRGIALQTLADANNGSFGVAQVNVLGSASHNVEQIQINSNLASSSLTTASAFFSGSVVISDSTGKVYANRTQYTATINNSVTPATLNITSQGASAGMPDGIYTLEYDYLPFASRNDPFNTRWGQGIINNRIDVIVNGQIAGTSTQKAYYVPSVKFTSTGSLAASKFVSPSGAVPAVNDVFIPLGFGPILGITSLSNTGTSSTPVKGTHYDIVHQDDAFGYSPASVFGLWWRTTTNAAAYNPAGNPQAMDVSYTYNTVPTIVQNNIANWRLLGTDVQVHAGRPKYLTFNFAIVYDRTVTPSSVNASVTSALDAYLKRLGFNAAVQVSDIVQVVHNVVGVDNVRFLTSTDNPTNYGIQLVQASGTPITPNPYNVSGRAVDAYFDERSYPLLQTVNFTVKARNTFRT